MRLLLAIALLASSSPAFAYRTLADEPDIPDDARVVFWKPVEVEVSQRGLDPARHGALASQLEVAIATWRVPACSDLSLTGARATSQRARAGDGRNTIEWVDDWVSRGFPVDAAASTDVQLATVDGRWRIVEGDIYLNGALAWDTFSTESDAVSLSAVLTHELGHLIGLVHPCDEGSCSTEQMLSVLAPTYESNRGALSLDDIEGLCALYPACDEACGSGFVCSHGTCVATECMRGECPTEFGFGSICAADSDCASGFCAEGRCTTECTTSSDCGGDSECSAELWCRDPRAPRNTCSSGHDCTTGLCLLGESEGTCTNTCASDDSCLAGESCVDADGENVCRAVSSGCSANGTSTAWLTFALVLGAFRRSGWGDNR